MSAPGNPPNDPAPDLVSQLVRQPPAAIEAWLHRPDPPARLNWRGLAEVAAFEALSGDAAADDDLTWARIAVFARERLAEATTDEHERSRLATDVMHLRAGLIDRRGAVPGDPLLDCDEIFRWFLARHGDSFDAVAADSSRWRELPIDRIRDLRYVKNELSVLRLLDRCPGFPAPDVQRWLSLWPRLP